MSEEKVDARHIEKLLAERYCDSYQWVFLTQVHNSTGGASRIADAMAFNMYASTGYEVLGFEIKVSRSDFLSELKDMSKSNEIMEYCDKWFLVVSDSSIVRDGELPKNWGLLVLKNGKLVMKVRPTPHKPKQMPMHFIASIMRRSANEVARIRERHVPREEIAAEIEKARKQGYEDARGYNGKQTENALKDLREQVRNFEEASGVPFEGWRGKEHFKTLGMFVKVALDMDSYSIRSIESSLEGGVKSLERAMVEIRKIKKEFTKQDNEKAHD